MLPDSPDHNVCACPSATNLIFYLLREPPNLYFIVNTLLHSTNFFLDDESTISHVYFFTSAYISSLLTFFYFPSNNASDEVLKIRMCLYWLAFMQRWEFFKWHKLVHSLIPFLVALGTSWSHASWGKSFITLFTSFSRSNVWVLNLHMIKIQIFSSWMYVDKSHWVTKFMIPCHKSGVNEWGCWHGLKWFGRWYKLDWYKECVCDHQVEISLYPYSMYDKDSF